jgi:hypothetical protein
VGQDELGKSHTERNWHSGVLRLQTCAAALVLASSSDKAGRIIMPRRPNAADYGPTECANAFVERQVRIEADDESFEVRLIHRCDRGFSDGDGRNTVR